MPLCYGPGDPDWADKHLYSSGAEPKDKPKELPLSSNSSSFSAQMARQHKKAQEKKRDEKLAYTKGRCSIL